MHTPAITGDEFGAADLTAYSKSFSLNGKTSGLSETPTETEEIFIPKALREQLSKFQKGPIPCPLFQATVRAILEGQSAILKHTPNFIERDVIATRVLALYPQLSTTFSRKNKPSSLDATRSPISFREALKRYAYNSKSNLKKKLNRLSSSSVSAPEFLKAKDAGENRIVTQPGNLSTNPVSEIDLTDPIGNMDEHRDVFSSSLVPPGQTLREIPRICQPKTAGLQSSSDINSNSGRFHDMTIPICSSNADLTKTLDVRLKLLSQLLDYRTFNS